MKQNGRRAPMIGSRGILVFASVQSNSVG